MVKIKIITMIHLFLEEEENSINYEQSFSFSLSVLLKERVHKQIESLDMEGNTNI